MSQPFDSFQDLAKASIVLGGPSLLMIFPGCCCYLYLAAWLPAIAAIICGFWSRSRIAASVL